MICQNQDLILVPLVEDIIGAEEVSLADSGQNDSDLEKARLVELKTVQSPAVDFHPH